ncbi:FGGY-family carbohydrate kinase [Flammeovirga sp. OC4]|uniref:FGGY-family carbohydrate kinase n=1 Tax=Flammeovirga sp. OC4 TaxID=1382345 RepID=UPI000693EDB2|nr:FGGY family carbohydrate kinase [Flammeovirga sp. OC4]
MLKEAIAVFDIGKTNKKLLIYDQNFKVIDQKSIHLDEIEDEDGSPTEDLDLLVLWMVSSFAEKLQSYEYKIVALNFSCYGASLVHLDSQGNRVGTFYNYLKSTSAEFYQNLYHSYGGEEVFAAKTASPVLQFLNSGLQLYWLKYNRTSHWNDISTSLHFPQYLHYKFTKQLATDITSIGCHTALWDFDKDNYHKWVEDEGLNFPPIQPNDYTVNIEEKITNHDIKVGIGIHDSTASVQPYNTISDGAPYILISTGTWAINMNPSFEGQLTTEQLKKDCLLNINTNGKKILSSRYMLGRVHDVYCKYLQDLFHLEKDFYQFVTFDEALLMQAWENVNEGKRYIHNLMAYTSEAIDISIPEGHSVDALYHQIMLELTLKEIEQIQEVMDDSVRYEKIFISGGFIYNNIFCKTIATFFDEIEVSTLSLENSSALGAALMVTPTHWNKKLEYKEYKVRSVTCFTAVDKIKID